jgi:hypothetical protein
MGNSKLWIITIIILPKQWKDEIKVFTIIIKKLEWWRYSWVLTAVVRYIKY